MKPKKLNIVIIYMRQKKLLTKQQRVEKIDKLGYNKNVKNKCCKHQGGTKT
mgnify:CR=1 FL=1